MHEKPVGLALLSTAGLVLALLTAIALPATAAKKPTSSTQTAQAIWTNFKPSGNTFGFTETATYAFSDAIASSAYAGPATTGPTVNCTGGGSNAGQPCNEANNPGSSTAPTAPAFPGVPNADKCTFWVGGTLSEVTATSVVTKLGLSGSGTWKYTYTFTWGGNAVGSDNPDDLSTGKGAWYVESIEAESGETATVIFTGKIAGLSAQRNSAGNTKYSFSMVENDGLTPRIANVLVRSYDSTTGALLSTYEVPSSVIDAWDEALGVADPAFTDFVIGGSGLSTLMAQTGATNILTTGDARTILNGDYFLGNNNGGSTGAALAYLQLGATHVDLPEGTFRVTLTANVKGIDGNADVSLSVTSSLKIFGLGSCA